LNQFREGYKYSFGFWIVLGLVIGIQVYFHLEPKGFNQGLVSEFDGGFDGDFWSPNLLLFLGSTL